MASKAAAQVADAAVETVARKAPFRLGQKQLYLPNNIVSFLRPKDGQSPTIATFEVPLTFNKLDFRDYLYHVYDVEVRSVRSFINQRLPAQRSLSGRSGKWYRPRSQKLMIVDLVKPFVWPERPTAEKMQDWDHKMYQAVEQGHANDVAIAERQARGMPLLRPNVAREENRAILAKKAKDLLEGKAKWNPGLTWIEVEDDGTEVKAAKGDETVEAEAEAEAGEPKAV
ncbi:hypothetical protein BD289DRAFT_438476 [Coniella lustricola]|uniref:Large ribosomal subunit protein uL23m n=1 Tax=Coniella lustricola TaxID=2025994 RepID=A0A2T3A2X7_9PEZI|nr:hypothetical protein BD289DRAFT_438476 [Coniella lustricola]